MHPRLAEFVAVIDTLMERLETWRVSHPIESAGTSLAFVELEREGLADFETLPPLARRVCEDMIAVTGEMLRAAPDQERVIAVRTVWATARAVSQIYETVMAERLARAVIPPPPPRRDS